MVNGHSKVDDNSVQLRSQMSGYKFQVEHQERGLQVLTARVPAINWPTIIVPLPSSATWSPEVINTRTLTLNYRRIEYLCRSR